MSTAAARLLNLVDRAVIACITSAWRSASPPSSPIAAKRLLLVGRTELAGVAAALGERGCFPPLIGSNSGLNAALSTATGSSRWHWRWRWRWCLRASRAAVSDGASLAILAWDRVKGMR